MSERPSEMPPFHERIEVADQRDEPEKRPWETFKHLIRQLRKAAGSGFSRQGGRWHAGLQDNVPAPAPEPQTLRSPVRSVQQFTAESDHPPLPKPRALATESLRRVSGAARQAQWQAPHSQARGLQGFLQRLYGPSRSATMTDPDIPRSSELSGELSGYRQALYPTQPNLAGMVIEDPAWIRENLAHARKPVSWHKQSETQNRVLQQQQAPQSRQKPAHLPQAEYRTRHEGKIDLWEKARRGEPLNDAEMAQLFHSIDLADYSATSPHDKQQVQKAFAYAEDLLARNLVAHAPRTEQREVVINGIAVPEESALGVARADIQNYRATDQHLKPAAMKDMARQAELRRIYDRANQIIQESRNAGDARAVDYFADTRNKATGINSLNPAIITNDLSAWHYFAHGLTVEGQDLQTAIQNIPITTNADSLRQSFLGLGIYSPDRNRLNPLPTALERWRKTGQEQIVFIPQVIIQTRGMELPDFSLGKVKLQATGIITRGKNGNPVFKAILEQGDNSEVYTFPGGERAWYWELPTEFGRSMPITLFRTIITGKRYIEVPLR